MTDDCASNLHEYCNPCDCSCHGEYLTKEEIKLFWEFLAHQHIGYENLPLLELIRKISLIANDE